MTKTQAKVSYQQLRAAIALGQTDIDWWNAPRTHDNKSYVLATFDAQCREFIKSALDGFDLDYYLEDGNRTLLAISVDQLDLDLPKPELVIGADGDEDEDTPRTRILQGLHEAGIGHLIVTFSGGGDSSNPDEFRVTDCVHEWYGGASWARGEASYSLGFRLTSSAAAAELPDALKDQISNWLWEELIQHDVVNNDGGGGDLVFDLYSKGAAEVLFSIYTNEMVTHEHVTEQPV